MTVVGYDAKDNPRNQRINYLAYHKLGTCQRFGTVSTVWIREAQNVFNVRTTKLIKLSKRG